MKLQFKVQPIPEYNQTRIKSKFAWLPTRIQFDKGVHYWIWLERYQEVATSVQIYFRETGWRTDRIKYDGELYPIRYLLPRE